jgi:hypothetical protein
VSQEVILGVWAGYALAGTPQNVPQDQLQPYIDEVKNEIHFLTDAATTSWGALRAKYGRNEPYPLKYIEVSVRRPAHLWHVLTLPCSGNEDFLSKATATYATYRWPMYVTQLKAAFPNLYFIDTAHVSTNLSPAATHSQHLFSILACQFLTVKHLSRLPQLQHSDLVRRKCSNVRHVQPQPAVFCGRVRGNL